jgi:TRAP-type C4-dicarboxylate transport system permease small subunit
MVQITFDGSAWLLRKEGHVTVDVVTSRLNEKNRTLFLMITSTIGFVIFLIITWFGIVATWGAYREHLYIPKQLEMPKFLVMLVIPFGSFMLAAQFLRRTLSAVSTRRSLRRKEEN